MEGFSSELKSSTSFHALHRAHPPASSSERPRSVSLPIGNSPLFPSPSSSFRPPPADEAEILRTLLSKDRVKREAKQRKVALQKSRANSMTSNNVDKIDTTSRPTDPMLEPQDTTPTKPKANGFSHGATASVEEESEEQLLTARQRPSNGPTPSRPTSSYLPFLPDLDASSSSLAKRLSVSISRRSSHMSSASSATYAQTPPLSPALTISTRDLRIKDYAFPAEDPRHIGHPSPSPEPSSSTGRITLPVPEGVFEDSSSEGGLSSSDRTTFAWDPSSSGSSGRPGDLVYTPDTDYEDEAEEAEGLDLPAGGALFVACYEFVPEAGQEMRLREGEVVRVFERLCEGWVVAGRQKSVPHPSDPTHPPVWTNDDETGLVPENYLRRFMSEEVEAAGQRLNAMDLSSSG